MYEQQFGLPQVGERRVTGFIGLVRLHDYAAGAILPHEQVMRGVVEDRLQLMRASNVQMEYIWSIYQDRAYAIDDVLEGVEPEPPSSITGNNHRGCGIACGGSPTSGAAPPSRA